MTDQTIETLLPVVFSEVGGSPVQTVNARDLHAWLEVGKDFSNWIKNRIKQYGLLQGFDYTPRDIPTGPAGGRPAKDYALSIDAAKVLAVTERNEKGKAALAYLIQNPAASVEELIELIQDIDLPDADEMFVYAIREVETGKVKLGVSKNPCERLKQLQTANPNRLEIAAIAEAPNRFADETALHRSAAALHIHGEWFCDGAAQLVAQQNTH